LALAHRFAPNDATIAYNEARVLCQQGKTDEAVRLAHLAVQQQPQLDAAHLLLAGAAVEKGDYDTAEQELKQVQNLEQEIALLIRGADELHKHQYQAAFVTFHQAMQLASSDAAPVYDLGLANQLGGNLNEARQLYQAALGLDPNLMAAHHNLGDILTQAENSQGAGSELQIASPGNATKGLGRDLERSDPSSSASKSLTKVLQPASNPLRLRSRPTHESALSGAAVRTYAENGEAPSLNGESDWHVQFFWNSVEHYFSPEGSPPPTVAERSDQGSCIGVAYMYYEKEQAKYFFRVANRSGCGLEQWPDGEYTLTASGVYRSDRVGPAQNCVNLERHQELTIVGEAVRGWSKEKCYYNGRVINEEDRKLQGEKEP